MDVDSIASPVLVSHKFQDAELRAIRSLPYLVTPTGTISNYTLSPNCESQQQPNTTSLTSAVISDVATRRFPLTATLAKNALEFENNNIRVASPSSIEEDMFEYYNSRGESVLSIEELPPPRIYSGSPSPPPYDTLGYFHIICPPEPPKTTNRIPTSVFQPPPPAQRIPTRATILLCKTKDCNAIIPFKHHKWPYCKRCTDCISQSKHRRDGPNTPSTSVAPQLGDSRLNYQAQTPPSFTIPTSFRRPKPLPLPARSTSVSTIRSVSGSESRKSTLSNSPITPDTSHSSNAAPNGANIESVTIGKKRSRCVTEPILASTATAEPSTVLAITEPARLNSPPRRAEPHIAHDSQSQPRPSQKTKRKNRTPAANSSSSVPAPTTIPSENGKISDPWLLRITAGNEQRRCIAPCTNMIPLSSSPYTLRCPSCVKADWIARKRGVESLMQARRAKKTTAKSEQEKKEKLRAKRRDSGSSINSLLSLSSLTSLGDSDEESEAELNATSTTELLDSTPCSAPMKVALRFPAEMWRRVRNLRYCSEDGCCKQLKEGYNESICVRCRAKKRERMRVFGVSCTAVWGMRGTFGDLQSDEEEEEVTMSDVIHGARLCASRWCSHVLPTKEEYRWSMCLGCRSYLVKREQRRGDEGEEKKGKKKIWGGKLTSGRNAGRCSSLDCGMLVGDEDQERRSATSLCVQCIRRKAREAERIELVRTMMGTATSSSTEPGKEETPTIPVAMMETSSSSTEPGKEAPTKPVAMMGTSSSSTEPEKEEAPDKPQSICKASCYPEFISFSALIAQFRAELHSFLRDQARLALRKKCMSIKDCESASSATKPPGTEPVAPSLGPFFTFKGQSSTVCSTPNILSPSHRTGILSHLLYVRSELERASLLQLRPQNTENPLVVFKEGFAVRFVCMHAIPLGWFLSGPSDANNEKIGEADLRRDIKGELDIIVSPDRSHHVLHGQTTMVKFRMGVINFS